MGAQSTGGKHPNVTAVVFRRKPRFKLKTCYLEASAKIRFSLQQKQTYRFRGGGPGFAKQLEYAQLSNSCQRRSCKSLRCVVLLNPLARTKNASLLEAAQTGYRLRYFHFFETFNSRREIQTQELWHMACFSSPAHHLHHESIELMLDRNIFWGGGGKQQLT